MTNPYQQKYERTPRGAYVRHRQNARNRGVGFLLTFDQWWGIWEASGKWAKRGNRKGQYCMMRFRDAGPYADGNVHIGKMTANTAERNQTFAARTRELGIERTVENAEEAPF